MSAFLAGWLANFKKEFRNGWPVLAIFIVIAILPISEGWRVLIEVLVALVLVALVAWAVRSNSRERSSSADRPGATS